MKMKWLFLISGIGVMLILLIIFSLRSDQNEPGPHISISSITKDKAAYNPGEKVQFKGELNTSYTEGFIQVSYYHRGMKFDEQTLSINGKSFEWEWLPPSRDHQGYLVAISLNNQKQASTIAVDVSSNWTAFPRYGFLSKFSEMKKQDQKTIIKKLNRYHINALQFYDWHDEHHLPLKKQDGRILTSWANIANKPVSLSTIENYIELAHKNGMKAMSYNLLYGSLKEAEADGVLPSWYVFKDKHQQSIDTHPLPDDWKSDIFLTDPGNKEWQDYIFYNQQTVFDELRFDGWHLDQLGDRGNVFNGYGQPINMTEGFKNFLQSVKERFPNHTFVMNAVNQYGQQQIAPSGVPFLYTEVWDPITTYAQLKNILVANRIDYRKNTVLAAYMNYDKADQKGFFNIPGILYTDALIFAHGGAHIELGEHMLAKEFFPNENLSMSQKLRKKLVHYYDFLVGYQNLLRGDELSPAEANLSSENVTFSDKPKKGTVYTFAKKTENKKMIHLLNYMDAAHMEWRDSDGTQSPPSKTGPLSITLQESRRVKSIWMASPDNAQGIPTSVEFEQKAGMLFLTVPYLEYWSMIAIEYEKSPS
ncbi:glycoside hydrolase family 66 protein [Halobacillus mangrovi]|uniref:Cycloisomaltooligosaccharide glucanotransferase n=1 Tax=Halobacillus mangrovi TaxID=402384 RepID=A0A1W5ZUA8_9BACI|nr:glycoside hydrolase family 66 protein [Halobacillus mangrovi]ARI76894.1 hypothetical protein HM131_08595 [Halobacillus mangrovi]